MMSFPVPRNALDRRLAPWNGTVPAFPIPFDQPNWCAAADADAADPRKISGGGGQACFWCMCCCRACRCRCWLLLMTPPLLLTLLTLLPVNNGCDIGSSSCDGVTGQAPGANGQKFKFTGKNGTHAPNWGGEGIVADWAGKIPRPKNLKYPVMLLLLLLCSWSGGSGGSDCFGCSRCSSSCRCPADINTLRPQERNATNCDPRSRTLNVDAQCNGPTVRGRRCW